MIGSTGGGAIKFLAIFGAASFLVGCVETEMPEPAQGQALFQANCAICHGATGAGDGVLANGLSPAPANLTLISARNNDHFPRARVLSAIDGYTRMQSAGQNMPEFGLLLLGDSVPVDVGDGVLTPTPRPLAALLAYLESIQDV